jgi:antitoxin HigA-1
MNLGGIASTTKGPARVTTILDAADALLALRMLPGNHSTRWSGPTWPVGHSDQPPMARLLRVAREPIHPGEFLQDELAELGISAAQLARMVHVPSNRISQILAGKRKISAETTLRLGRWFGTGPRIWLNLQQAYELDLAQRRLGDRIDTIEPRTAA